MSIKNVTFRNSSCRSLNSFQNLQKLKEIFFKVPVNYEHSFEKLLADSKFSLQDEPINRDFFTYYTVKSNSDFKKSNGTKPSDTQSKILEFMKNCIFSNQLFGSCQETKTRNKACMCKPVKKDTDTEPKYGKHDETQCEVNNNVIKTRDKSFGSEDSKNNVPEEDISSKSKRRRETSKKKESGDFGITSSTNLTNFGLYGKERDPLKISKKEKESSTVSSSDNFSKDNYRKRNNSVDNQTKPTGKSVKEDEKAVNTSTFNKGNAKVITEACTVPWETRSCQLPKLVLHLPVDFTQFEPQSTRDDLKLVLCDSRRNECNCELQTEERKKKSKGMETDSVFRDGETTTDYDNLDPDTRAYPQKGKPKKKLFSCFKCCHKKSKNKKNQTECSDLCEREHQNVNTVSENKTKNVAKCCRCNKFDPESPMSGEQIDTLKLLIKMEAKQNYRQINILIKELNEQQEDIRKLRETYNRLIQYFPDIFEGKNAEGDYLSNEELKQNVKTLFEMCKELSVKINEIHRLSKDFNKNNSEILNNKYFHERPLSEKMLSVKPPVEDFSESSTTSKTEEDNSRFNGVSIPNRGEISESTGVSVTKNPHYVDELPEKLPKSERASVKKQTCPCEINSGIYSINNVKF